MAKSKTACAKAVLRACQLLPSYVDSFIKELFSECLDKFVQLVLAPDHVLRY